MVINLDEGVNNIMIKIRKAQESDSENLLRILKELDLYYPAQSLKDFRVAEKEGQIIGIVRLEEKKDFYFLSSLGILKEHRKQGVALTLLREITSGLKKNVYLYTIISEFFEKFGFESASPLPGLPLKESLECENCFPGRCVCMVKFPHAS